MFFSNNDMGDIDVSFLTVVFMTVLRRWLWLLSKRLAATPNFEENNVDDRL